MDIWRCAIVRQPVLEIVNAGLDPSAFVWLPDTRPLTFRADPFGLWRDGKLHVFAEIFDYRSRIGHIEVLTYDRRFDLLDRRTALSTPWHLSYPFVFEADGECWMLPEAYRSGTLTLYRAKAFPIGWEPVCDIPLDGAAIDATPLFHQGRWWLFYTPSAEKAARRSHLHVAWSDRLTGPWHLHPRNPVRIDMASARPGGVPFIWEERVILPVQDCRSTYGGAIRMLSVRDLTETEFEADDAPGLSAPAWAAPFTEGLHTLASAGPVTLIDVKTTTNSVGDNLVRMRGIARRALRETRLLPWRALDEARS